MYYADTTVFKDRFDASNQNSSSIIDFKNFRAYILLEGGIYY
jgi:hypothetical protein